MYIPRIHFGPEEYARQLVKGARYRWKTKQKVDPALVATELAHSKDNVVVRHFFLRYSGICLLLYNIYI